MRRKQYLTTWIGYSLMLTLLLWYSPKQASAESAPVLVGAGDIAGGNDLGDESS